MMLKTEWQELLKEQVANVIAVILTRFKASNLASNKKLKSFQAAVLNLSKGEAKSKAAAKTITELKKEFYTILQGGDLMA